MDYYVNLPIELKMIVKSFIQPHILDKVINNYNKKLNNDPKKIALIEDGKIYYKRLFNGSFYDFMKIDKLKKVYTHDCYKTNTHKWLNEFEQKHKNKYSNEFMLKEIYKLKQEFKRLPKKEYSINPFESKDPEIIKEKIKRYHKENFKEFMKKRINFLDDELYQQIVKKYPIKSYQSLFEWENFISSQYISTKRGHIPNHYIKKESVCLVKF